MVQGADVGGKNTSQEIADAARDTYRSHPRIPMADHFNAISVADLEIPYTSTTSSTGSITLGADDEPSAAVLSSGATDGSVAALDSDRTVSLSEAPGSETTLVLGVRAKLNSEANIDQRIWLENEATEIDNAGFYFDTAAAGRDTGALYCETGGASTIDEVNYAGAFDLTNYHIYEIKLVPGSSCEFFIDGARQGTVSSNVPPDNSFHVHLRIENETAADKVMTVDYWEVDFE